MRVSVSEFKRAVPLLKWSHASLGEEDKLFPVKSIIHISEVAVVDTFPAVIRFTDGINVMQLSQIQSIELADWGCYKIVCGNYEENRITILAFYEPENRC